LLANSGTVLYLVFTNGIITNYSVQKSREKYMYN